MISRSRLLAAALIAPLIPVVASADSFGYGASYNQTTQASQIGLVDINTGAFTPSATLPQTFFNDISYYNGKLYALAETGASGNTNEFGTINLQTGTFQPIVSESVIFNSFSFAPDGTLYATTYTGTNTPEGLYTLNPLTGAATFIANLSGGNATSTSQVRFGGNTLYTTTYTDPSLLYSINFSTGAGTLVGNTGLIANNGLDGYLNGNLLTTVNPDSGSSQIFYIDPATGAATAGPNTAAQILTLIPASAPEPQSVGLVALAGSALWVWRKRRAN